MRNVYFLWGQASVSQCSRAKAAFRPGARAAARDVGAALVPDAGGRPAGVPWRVLARGVPHVGVDRRVPGPPARPRSAGWCALGMCRVYQTDWGPWQGWRLRHFDLSRRVSGPPAWPRSARWCAPNTCRAHQNNRGPRQDWRFQHSHPTQHPTPCCLFLSVVHAAALPSSISCRAHPAFLASCIDLLFSLPHALARGLLRVACAAQCMPPGSHVFRARRADADCAGVDFCPWQYPEIHADEASASGMQ